MKRVIAVVALGGVVAIVGLVGLGARSPRPERAPEVAARAGSDRRVARLLDTPPPELRAAVADAEAPEPALAAVVEPAPRITGVAFAAHFATDICACADQACADQVNETYNRQLGQVLPETDAQAQHEAFARAAACRASLPRAASE